MIEQNGNFKPLSIDEFSDFYAAVHSRPPLAWQSELAQQVCISGWPQWIDLPTASGKTAVIDIAVFALAYQATQTEPIESKAIAPRRIFFTVDRRLVVSQAYQQGRKVSEKLWQAVSDRSVAQEPILVDVAKALQTVSGGGDHAVPLDCYELRGGIPRDDAWIRSPTQPTLLTTTVDQIGSRLLFRGYGVSDRNLPIHAALTGNDALILLDEAHCSVPFGETVDAIQRYRGEAFAEQPIESPFRFVQMTATPPKTDKDVSATVFAMEDRHYEQNEILRRRHDCGKPIELCLDDQAKGKTMAKKLAKTLVSEAMLLAKNHGLRKIAVVVNRVDVAKEAHALLLDKNQFVDLMIGRMRPIDRDAATERLISLYQSDSQGSTIDDQSEPTFLVATQTIEVGADFDFDGMVTQCASLDSLKQRFGRLNRLGNHANCRGVIVGAVGDLVPLDKLDDEKPIDPVYGNALVRTWHMLSDHGVIAPEGTDDGVQRPVVDFAIRGDQSINALSASVTSGCHAVSLHALTLMPAHVDALCQTMPKPSPDPDIAMYLHGVATEGKRSSTPSVRLVWRSDLRMPPIVDGLHRSFANTATRDAWTAAIDACPPSTAECMSVPRYLVQMWMKGLFVADDYADVDGESRNIEDPEAIQFDEDLARFGLVWRGGLTPGPDQKKQTRSYVVGPKTCRGLQDGDTVVLPAEFGGWEHFGHVPNGPKDPTKSEAGRRGIKAFFSHQKKLLAADQSSDGNQREEDLYAYRTIDVADSAYQIARARTVFRFHKKIAVEGIERALTNHWLERFGDTNTALSTDMLAKELGRWIDGRAGDDRGLEQSSRLRTLTENGRDGFVKRYPGGFIWASARHPTPTGMPPLPSESFDDGLESRSGIRNVRLIDHLSDVYQELDKMLRATAVRSSLAESMREAARWHDLGKVDPRFQSNLMGIPLSRVFMQPHYLAKSDGYGRSRCNSLPSGFRHEFLSASLLNLCDLGKQCDVDLVRYLIQSHHGYARPLAGLAFEDLSPVEIDLSTLGGPSLSAQQRQSLPPLGHLESGLADDFWAMNRLFGPWGIAYLESMVRLADWKGSGCPTTSPLPLDLAWHQQPSSSPKVSSAGLLFPGLDAASPLGALATFGLFRVLAGTEPASRFAWANQSGVWHPIVYGPLAEASESALIGILVDALIDTTDDHPALAQPDRNQTTRDRFIEAATKSKKDNRHRADWLTCQASEAVSSDAISQLQTSRRDYHAVGIRGLMDHMEGSHLHRVLFEPWDYADPIAGVSLHLEPREDRRHAYQWHQPSGDPTRKVHGGMIGANRLALEAWPMFQSLPVGDRLMTAGFRGRRVRDTTFSWPVWTAPVSIETVRSLLALDGIRQKELDSDLCRTIGVADVFRSARILVGKTPNFTAAVAVTQ